MKLDPSLAPLFVVLAAAVTGLFSLLVAWLTKHADRRTKENEANARQITDLRDLKDDYRQGYKDLQERMDEQEKRHHDDMEAMEQRHNTALRDIERKFTAKIDELANSFAKYVKWTRDGATPPEPTLPDQIAAILGSVLPKGHKA